MTGLFLEVGFDVDLFPVQACREAQDEPEVSGCACLSVASSRPAASSEHRRGPIMIHYGQECRVPFLLVPFLWAIKEKILVHKGRKARQKPNRRLKKKTSRAPAQKIRPGRTKQQNNA